eukprot:jgi/Botrbrau1/2438/Bobra.0395s0059.1
MLVSSTYLNAGQRLILGNRGAPVSGVTSLRRRRCSIQGRRNSSVTTALFGARGSGKNQQNGPQKIAPPPEIPLTQKVHVPSTATAVAAGLLGGFLAYLFWSKLYEYWKRVAPHHADKNDPGPYGGAFAKGPPPPKAVPLIPATLSKWKPRRSWPFESSSPPKLPYRTKEGSWSCSRETAPRLWSRLLLRRRLFARWGEHPLLQTARLRHACLLWRLD